MDTVDGSDMWRMSPVEVGSEYPIIYKVLAPSQVVIAGFLNHQQYLTCWGQCWDDLVI